MLCNPIYNDVPIRLFDALLAGAIPIVPYGLSDLGLSFSDEEQGRLPVLSYLPDDLQSLRTVHREAVARFDEGGAAAAERRRSLALSRHMFVHRIALVLSHIVRCARFCAR